MAVKARFAIDAINAIVGAYPTVGGFFKTHPELCPTGKRQVTIGIETDADGRHFLPIDLQTPMMKRTTSRDGTQGKRVRPSRRKTMAEVKGVANPDSTPTI